MNKWTDARYRLMALSTSGAPYEKASGSLIYLRLIASNSQGTRGRQWIEMNFEPAVIKRKAA